MGKYDTYTPLDVESIPVYLKSVPEVKRLLGDLKQLDCSEVGDGNLNLVFVVTSKISPDSTVVIKQALPYLRCAGEGWPLGRERIGYEYMALTIERLVCPNLLPKLYHFDEAMSLIIMENLKSHKILRKGLVEGTVYPKLASDIGHFLSHTLFKTSDMYLNSKEKKELTEKFVSNTALCKITEDFVFTNPFMDSSDNRWNPAIDREVAAVRADTALKTEITALKYGFLTHAEALLHGDFHSGSIMLNESDTRIIDPEFAFFGPMGFDIGAFIGNIILAYCSHLVHPGGAEYQQWLLSVIKDTWQVFESEFLELWRRENRGEATRSEFFALCGGEEALELYRRRYMRNLLSDTAGYAGCKMLRRMMGIAHVYDIDCIEDEAQRAVAEKAAIRIGSRLVKERGLIGTVDDIISIIKTTV